MKKTIYCSLNYFIIRKIKIGLNKKMAQIEINDVSAPECVELEVCVEKAEKEKEHIEEKKIHKEPVKNKLLKLIKKSKLNAKYPEHVIPIQRLERQRVYRNYGLR